MPALDEFVQTVERTYAPVGNVHQHELDGKFLSTSKLVSKTAYEYANQILGQADDVDKYYVFKGMSLGDAALTAFPHKEIKFTYPLGNEWFIQGHCDAIAAKDGEVVVLEHKAHSNPTDDKVEKAFRQGLLYLAMGWAEHQRSIEAYPGLNVTTFSPSAYAPNNPAFLWPRDAKPSGVIVCIAPDRPPAMVVKKPVTPTECMEMLAFYAVKATCIINAITSKDLRFASDWDLGPLGCQEFTMTLDQMDQTPDEELDLLIKVYRERDDQYRILEGDVKMLRSKIESKMVMADQKKVVSSGHLVHLVEMPAAPVNFIRKPYRQLRIKEL